MGKNIRTAEQKTALVIWRNIIAAIIIMLLIVARQWIIQDNIEKNENISALLSASLRELIVMERVENRMLYFAEMTDPAERENLSEQIKNDLLQWEDFHIEINDRLPAYLKSGNASASAEELKASAENLFLLLKTSISDRIAAGNNTSGSNATPVDEASLQADFAAYRDVADPLAAIFDNALIVENNQADFLETILFYVLLLAVLLQIILVFLPGQRKLYESVEQVKFLGEHDRLTELYQAYTFQRKIEEEVAEKNSGETPLRLMLLDINELPFIIQKSGRRVADEVLRGSAQTIRSCLGDQDYAGRLQNDAFAILLREKSEQEVNLLADRLRTLFTEASYPVAGKITSSIGFSAFHDKETVSTWMNRAETAMLQAKGEGKNRIVSESMIRQREMPGTIHWLDNWSSGNEELDRQHGLLIDIGNQLLSMQISGSDACEEALLLQKFQREIVSHFVFEEKLMRDIGYPYTVNHSMMHEKLTDRARQMIAEFEAHNLTAGYIYSFLVEDIIVGHINAEDTKFFPLIPHEKG